MPEGSFKISDMRVFVKGVEISELIKNINIECKTGFFTASCFGMPDKQVPLTHTTEISMTLKIGIGNIKTVGDQTILFIDELPTDEFLAEMIRLKFKREGIIEIH